MKRYNNNPNWKKIWREFDLLFLRIVLTLALVHSSGEWLYHEWHIDEASRQILESAAPPNKIPVPSTNEATEPAVTRFFLTSNSVVLGSDFPRSLAQADEHR